MVGAAALPAKAQTYQDTALSATAVTASTFGGGTLAARNGTGVITLSGTGTVTWSIHGTAPTGVSLSGTTISYAGAAGPARPPSWSTPQTPPATPRRS